MITHKVQTPAAECVLVVSGEKTTLRVGRTPKEINAPELHATLLELLRHEFDAEIPAEEDAGVKGLYAISEAYMASAELCSELRVKVAELSNTVVETCNELAEARAALATVRAELDACREAAKTDAPPPSTDAA